MEELEKLNQELESERKNLAAAQDALVKMNERVKEKLKSFLSMISSDDIIVRYAEVRECWSSKELEKSKWEISAEVGFQDKNEKPGHMEFGSSFNLYVYEHCIKINHGCIGTYSREDYGQIARDKLIGTLWSDTNDEVLIKTLSKEIDMNIYKNELDICTKVNNINRQIQDIQNKIEWDNFMTKLKSNKYFITLAERYDWDTQSYHKEYCRVYEINRITDTNVINHQIYVYDDGQTSTSACKQLTKLFEIFSKFKRNDLVLSNEILRGRCAN